MNLILVTSKLCSHGYPRVEIQVKLTKIEVLMRFSEKPVHLIWENYKYAYSTDIVKWNRNGSQ